MSNLLLTIILTLFTWFLTALGSSTIFLFKNINNKILACHMSVTSFKGAPSVVTFRITKGSPSCRDICFLTQRSQSLTFKAYSP